MRRSIYVLVASSVLVSLLSSTPVLGQNSAPLSEVQALRQEILKLQERLNRLEQTQRPAVTPAAAQAQPFKPPPGEREISLEKENILETIGLPKPEVAGVKFTGFAVSSFSYNSGFQIVPEAFGGTPALADPGRTNFRFDKFGLGVSKVFTDWLSAGAGIEVESHRDRHSHIITDGSRGCPRGDVC